MKISSPRPLFVSASADLRISTRKVDAGPSFKARLDRDAFEGGPRQKLDELDRRIAAGAKDGSLTAGEAAQLQRKADALRSALKDGVSPRERQQLEGLSRELRHERHDPQAGPSLDDRKSGFAERISAGLADGSLTAREARNLAERLEQLGPNPDPKEVNQLSRAIFGQRHDRQVAPG